MGFVIEELERRRGLNLSPFFCTHVNKEELFSFSFIGFLNRLRRGHIAQRFSFLQPNSGLNISVSSYVNMKSVKPLIDVINTSIPYIAFINIKMSLEIKM